MDTGLRPETLGKIIGVFAKSGKINRARLFGSRALGTFQEGSDIDLALEGNGLTMDDILGFKVKLEDLNLPYHFDVVDFATISNPTLVDHIERVGIALYDKNRHTSTAQ